MGQLCLDRRFSWHGRRDDAVEGRGCRESAEHCVELRVHFGSGTSAGLRGQGSCDGNGRGPGLWRRDADLYTHLSTSAIGLDEARLRKLYDAGLDAVQISLQDARAEANDSLAGTPSFERKRDGIRTAKSTGGRARSRRRFSRAALSRSTEVSARSAQAQLIADVESGQ